MLEKKSQKKLQKNLKKKKWAKIVLLEPIKTADDKIITEIIGYLTEGEGKPPGSGGGG
jgi:heptaprenylglyceryl phosphate synthase